MPKNILIFSDGTGQGGGVALEEMRSNVYKLYRATKSGPDTSISPDEQIAFYDPGLGSSRDREDINFGYWRKLYNILSQATGLGITRNIIDCYAFIIQHWEKGDRIYIYGFSRGAYTARCVGGVLSRCGVPTLENGKPIKRDAATAQRIAREAVVEVYQHAVGRTSARFEPQRKELSNIFRKKYSSNAWIKGEEKGWSNEVPYLIGVWDTVAALGASLPKLLALFGVIFGLLWTIISSLWYYNWLPASFQNLSYETWVSRSLITIIGVAILYYLYLHIRMPRGLSDPFYKTIHLRKWKMKFYDNYLNSRVRYAKHALAIDENREAFKQVKWIDNTSKNQRGKPKNWFEQVWFSGVHSDVGGSYPETESRLSDISLKWMVERSLKAKYPILIDDHYLRIYPNSKGVQHDERKNGWMPWKLGLRKIPDDAPLHTSVIERFKADHVVHFDEVKPYRPCSLKSHQSVKKHYKKT